MQAIVERNGDITVVHVSGRLVYDMIEDFKQSCQQSLLGQKLVFNLSSLNFVGSSGITNFVDAIRELATMNETGVKMIGVSSEFKKIFTVVPTSKLEIWNSETEAFQAFSRPPGEQYQFIESQEGPAFFVEELIEEEGPSREAALKFEDGF